jgi:hypothetical protein
MNRLIDHYSSASFDRSVRMDYMQTVASAADELGISNNKYPYGFDGDDEVFTDFSIQVTGTITRIRLRRARQAGPHSVRLSSQARVKIQHLIQRLRAHVASSDLSHERQVALYSKLDEFEAELQRPRASFANVMTIVTCLAAATVGSTTFLADAPNALNTILRIFGREKEAEEREHARLGPPPKLITNHSTAKSVRVSDRQLDDVPF